MKKKETTKKSSSTVKLAFLGVSLAGLAATTYFFLGPKGKKHQKHAKSWAIKMKGDVVEKLEKTRDISEPIYNAIIDAVGVEYEKSKKAGHEEISVLTQDLKKHWKVISGGAKTVKRDVIKSVKNVKSVVKNVEK